MATIHSRAIPAQSIYACPNYTNCVYVCVLCNKYDKVPVLEYSSMIHIMQALMTKFQQTEIRKQVAQYETVASLQTQGFNTPKKSVPLLRISCLNIPSLDKDK